MADSTDERKVRTEFTIAAFKSWTVPLIHFLSMDPKRRTESADEHCVHSTRREYLRVTVPT